MPSRAEVDIAMERYSSGDEAAFADVYDALAPRLYGYLLRQTRDQTRAEDLVQQTMLQIHRARDRFIPGAKVIPWSFAIARQLFFDALRCARREVHVAVDCDPDERPGPGGRSGDFLRAREFATQIERVLAGLPFSLRAAFELTEYDGLSVADAAQVLGTTVAAVKIRAHLASKALRLALSSPPRDVE